MELGYVRYKPYEQRTVDTQYKDLLRDIWNNGEETMTAMGQKALRRTTRTMFFDLSNGIPIITERNLVSPAKSSRNYIGQALAEMCAFLNGARWIHELESFGCYWWKPWATEEKAKKRGLEVGDLGPGSYGPAWTNFPTKDEKSFNQIDALVEQVRYRPELKTHYITAWIPEYNFRTATRKQKALVSPCHGNVTICLYPERGFFDVIHDQRSADCLVGLPANLIGYSAFALMLAQVTGYRVRRLEYVIRDSHIYEIQYPFVERVLSAQSTRFASIEIPKKESMQDYRVEDFVITDCDPQNERFRIPTPV